MTYACALCGRRMSVAEGGATIGGEWVYLCHPFLGDSQDCYRLVTVYGATLPVTQQTVRGGAND